MQSFGLSVLMASDLNEYFEIDNGESGSESVISTKVTVTGFQVGTENEEMKTFFESKSRSGGGDIVAFELNQYRNVVTVEFKHHNDANEVLQKANKEGGILYNGMMLKASPFIEPIIDTSKVFVSGMSDKTSDELATLFMEAKWHIVPKKLVRGIVPGTALVEFSSHQDITKLKSICEKNACAEAFWNVSLVEVPSKVLVTGCSSTTTIELLDLYFENKKRSGGGDVLYVEPHHDFSNEFMIIFNRVSDAERVVKENRTHVLDNCNLTVSLYYACLDRDPSEEIAIPEPVLIDDLDIYRAKFLFESDQQKAKIEASLKDVFGRPVWTVGKSSKLLQIECTVNLKDSLSRPFINNWKERCRERMSWIFEELTVDETNVVASELFEQLKIKLQSVKVRRPEALAIVLDRKSSGIVIVGESKEVEELSKDIAKLIRKLENGLAKNKTPAAMKSIPLPPSWNMRFGDRPQVVMLKPFEQEFTTLAQRFCSETLVPMQTIVSIERIQNPPLYMQYYGKKKEMETANKGSLHPIERRLWHGLQSADAAKNINQKGFNRNLYSVNARTSLRYCQLDATGSRRMYCADVLTGDFCPGIGNIKKPPSRNDPSNPTRCFDSTTDNLAAPNLFAIFHDAQAYPSFLITFG